MVTTLHPSELQLSDTVLQLASTNDSTSDRLEPAMTHTRTRTVEPVGSAAVRGIEVGHSRGIEIGYHGIEIGYHGIEIG